jgi:DNA transformation protein
MRTRHGHLYLQYVLEQLDGLRGIIPRRMFGGVGLYFIGGRQDHVFFGLLFRDTLYFKADDSNRPDYESRGMGRFQPYADKPHLSFTYYEVPAEILEDRDELTTWARRSVAAAMAIEAKKDAGRKASTGRIRRADDAKRATACKHARAGKPATTATRSTARKRASAKKKSPARR